MKAYNVYALRHGEFEPSTTLFLGSYKNKEFAEMIGEKYKEYHGGKYELYITTDILEYAQFIPESKIIKVIQR